MPTIETVRRPVALVTGASSGIGEEIARVLASEGEDLVLVARSEGALRSLADELSATYGHLVLPVALDLEQADAVDRLVALLAERGLAIRHLINNAGYGLAGDIMALPRRGQVGIVDLNCRALLDLTIAFLPEIVAERGGILNVASVAGFTAGPGFAVYYASKAFVVSLSRALRAEMEAHGVKVSVLCPGPTPTRFNARAGFKGGRIVSFIRPLDARSVAVIGIRGYRAGRSIIVPGFTNKCLVAALSLLPQAVVLPILGRVQRGRLARPAAQPLP